MRVGGWASRRVVFAATAVMITIAVGASVARVSTADDGFAVVPTDASEPAQGWDSVEFWRREELLGELNRFIAEYPLIEKSGFVTHVTDSFPMSATLMWHGPANPVQQAVKAKARELGIAVTVVQRRYGRDVLDRAMAGMAGRSGKGAFANFTIYGWSLDADFDGVVVDGQYLRPPTVGRAEADAELARAAAAELGVAVDIRLGGELVPG
jgi:hypothetical protein